VCSLTLAACSGHDDDDMPPPAPAMPPPRGSLIEAPVRTASLTPEAIPGALTSAEGGQLLLNLIVPPKCGIDVYQLRYNTVDPAGAPTTASGAIMIPTGADPACQGPRPIVLYAHGTAVQRSLNLANISVQENLEALLAATMFTTQGYVLIAPNYTGYDTSALTYHPYLNADQEAKDMIDALTAARSALPAPVTDSGKLFVTGYSQGGHVAMATHKMLQETGGAIAAVCRRCIRRCGFLRPGHALDAAVPGLHLDWLSESVRRRVCEPDRSVRSALRDRHRDTLAERGAAHAAVR
jgi:acetyl esterase/lipase